MSNTRELKSREKVGSSLIKIILATGALLALFLAFVFLSFIQVKSSGSFGSSITSLLALDSPKIWWYVTRAAGVMGYMLFWLSTVWGFATASKLLDKLLERTYTFDFHEFITWLSLGFIGLHVIVLMVDKFKPFSMLQILVPFVSSYRPFWVGIGIISMYLAVLVTVTFYLRSKISMQIFRKIHVLSVVSYLAAFLHGVFSGTDTSSIGLQVMYWGTFMAAVFFFLQWIITLIFKKIETGRKTVKPSV